uniref:NACHT domain-containing protein n=1 Tax=Candidatus Kentrum sp. FW TaxID=2126338 RepID=A0A450U4C9_9GAMM|nr:MAG: hypothetical protein BECKFW1821C_GA0114237_11831 [Candidatus Kentron sp. FW]
MPLNRSDMLIRLKELPDAQFEELVFQRQLETVVPGKPATRTERAIELIRAVETHGDTAWLELESSFTQPPQLKSTAPVSPDPFLPHGLSQLKTYGGGFAGRGAELAALDAAWAGGEARVFVLHAEGGAGKTRLLVKWLGSLGDVGWRGAGGVFVHSFYSQGSDERRNASSELFFQQALNYFGFPGEPPTDPIQKAEELARLIRARRGLLVLDGLEPLQHPPAFNQGRLKDPAMGHLLMALAGATADREPALCVITSRQPITELAPHQGKAIVQRPLDRLDAAAGIALLREFHVRGTEEELARAVADYHGHAYSLMLLGSYLFDATDDHHIRRRSRIPLLAEDRERGGHAGRLFRAYVNHLGEDSPEAALLRLLGFFDRAAEWGLLAVLIEGPRIFSCLSWTKIRVFSCFSWTKNLPGLTGPSPEQWQRVLNRLKDLHLIAFDGPHAPIDAHPLLREWFAAALERESPEFWRAGHQRLFEHLTATTPQRPDTLEGLQPLYQAVAHGCKAGLHEKARADVYRDRILRGTGDDGFYSTKKLGAFGADLGAVANFFVDSSWRQPAPSLAPADRAWLLNDAAFSLRALGRLEEALAPMGVGLERYIKQEDWENAAASASNLSELQLTLGRIERAVADGGRAVQFADRSGDGFLRMVFRTTHGDARHQAGDRGEALALFQAAEAMQKEDQPQYPRLYSLPGFRYCDLLLSGMDGGAERAAWWVWLGGVWHRRASSASEDLPSLGPGIPGGMTEVAEREATDPDNATPVIPPGIGGTQGWQENRFHDPDGMVRAVGEGIDACERVTARARETLVIAERNNWLLGIALDHLTLARAGLYRGLLAGDLGFGAREPSDPPRGATLADIEAQLTPAVENLRKSGRSDYLPRGLLTRAWYRALTNDPDGARADLAEAGRIAADGPMPLFEMDILLTRARLFGGREGAGMGDGGGDNDNQYPWGSVTEDLRAARRLMEKHGYGRRKGELADAEEILLGGVGIAGP